MIKKTRIKIRIDLNIYYKTVKLFFNYAHNNLKKFEILIINYLKSSNIIITSQGRVAAYNIFKHLITTKKKEILLSPYTLPEVVRAIKLAGGKPKYLDIDIKTGLPDEKSLLKYLSDATAAIIITHLYSNESNILNFKMSVDKKIPIIEDTAINFGSEISNGKKLGTLFDYGFFSFGTMKNLSTFHGGAIYVKDTAEYEKIKKNVQNNIPYPTKNAIKLVLFCFLINFLYSKIVFSFFTYYILRLQYFLKLNFLDKIIYPGVYPNINLENLSSKDSSLVDVSWIK